MPLEEITGKYSLDPSVPSCVVGKGTILRGSGYLVSIDSTNIYLDLLYF